MSFFEFHIRESLEGLNFKLESRLRQGRLRDGLWDVPVGGAVAEFSLTGTCQDFSVNDFDYFGDLVQAWCLVPAKSKAVLVSNRLSDAQTGELVPSALANAYGGVELDFHELCVPDPLKARYTSPRCAPVARGKPDGAGIRQHRGVGAFQQR